MALGRYKISQGSGDFACMAKIIIGFLSLYSPLEITAFYSVLMMLEIIGFIIIWFYCWGCI
jgi:hypothetical protein